MTILLRSSASTVAKTSMSRPRQNFYFLIFCTFLVSTFSLNCKLRNSEVINAEDFDGKIDFYGYKMYDFKNVSKFFSTRSAFTAVLKDGTIRTAGNPHFGGNAPHHLTNYQSMYFSPDINDVFSTGCAFSVLKSDKTVESWGCQQSGGFLSKELKNKLKNVKNIFSNLVSFAALAGNSTDKDFIITWGAPTSGGEITKGRNIISIGPVETIESTNFAFAALLKDGRVFVWGNPCCGGSIPKNIRLSGKKK